MKKKISILSFIICCVLAFQFTCISVNAGEFDKNEKFILESISSEKFPVKIEQRYINQFKNYFCQDEVRLSKAEAEDFLKYFKAALQCKKDLEKSNTLKGKSETYIGFEKAGSVLGLLLSYDSATNDFYFIDESGYIVFDFQDIIKKTDKGDDSERGKFSIPTEAVFTFVVALCILGLVLNLGRWSKKLKQKNKERYEDEDEDEDELEVANRRTRKARWQTFSYKNVKQILRYCFVPIVMGLIVLCIGMIPMKYFSDITTSVKSNFINTQSIFVENIKEFHVPDIKKEKQKKKISLSDIVTPKYGEQYGGLSCKELKISAPIFFGDRGNILQKGAGQYNGSFLPGEGGTILIGAHDTTYFKNLEKVKKGHKFEFYTEYGIYDYKVSDIKIYDEEDYHKAYDLGAKKEKLILYTCYPFGKLNGTKTQRMFVYLDKISGPDIRY